MRDTAFAFSRREILRDGVAWMLTCLGPQTHGADEALSEIDSELWGELLRLCQLTRRKWVDGLVVTQPSVGTYRGFWPDDWYFPNLMVSSLLSNGDASRLFSLLTLRVAEKRILPDRLDEQGHCIFQPGAINRPHGVLMPAHLPAAWFRVVKYLFARTGDSKLKELWVGVFNRSLDALCFKDGLVYLSDTVPQVGFGFFDAVGLQGHDLMCSVLLEKALREMAVFFGGEFGARCGKLAAGIRSGIGLLRTTEGWYLSDTVGCRQFSPWSNGLLYGSDMIDEGERDAIRAYFLRVLPKIRKFGMIRHSSKFWNRMNPVCRKGVGTYMNGGYWSVGTAFVLQMLYDSDRNAAVLMLRDMLEALRKCDFAEWVDDDFRRFGAQKFLMGVAMPLAAAECILKGRKLIDIF